MGLKFKFIIFAMLLLPLSSEALEFDLAEHLGKLGGTPSDHQLVGVSGRDSVAVKKLMSKYMIGRWSDDNLDVQIGASKDSIFLLIDNKTKDFIQYKLEIRDEQGKVIGFNRSWYDLMPEEESHIGGSPLFTEQNKLIINILSRPKVFKSDVEKLFTKVINSNGSPHTISQLGNAVLNKVLIFPRYEVYRSDPNKAQFQNDLHKVDQILSIVEKKRNQIGLIDVPNSEGQKVKGIYDQDNNIVVTTAAMMPTTKLVKFNSSENPNISYYFYNEYIGDYFGELRGAAYSILFRVVLDETEILFESKDVGSINLIFLNELVILPNTDDLFVIGRMNHGVASSDFVANLKDKEFLEVIHFGFESEGGHEECPEEPFFLCG